MLLKTLIPKKKKKKKTHTHRVSIFTNMSENTIWVTNVADEVNEGNVREFFAFCGKIRTMKRQWDHSGQKFGYEVDFEKRRSVGEALQLTGVYLII